MPKPAKQFLDLYSKSRVTKFVKNCIIAVMRHIRLEEFADCLTLRRVLNKDSYFWHFQK